MRAGASPKRSSHATRSVRGWNGCEQRPFAAGTGGVTERRSAIDASEELARKGQELREMTHDLDLIKVEVDLIAMIARLRGAAAATDAKSEESADGEDGTERQHEGR